MYEGQLKSSWAYQDTLMECDQMSFIFQHSPLYKLFPSVLQYLDPIGQKADIISTYKLSRHTFWLILSFIFIVMYLSMIIIINGNKMDW